MPTLLERLRAARERWVAVASHELLLRRPTGRAVFELVRQQDDGALLRQCVVAWRNVREVDLVPGGEGIEAPFDPDLCVEWLEDRPDLFADAVKGVVALIEDYTRQRDDDQKK